MLILSLTCGALTAAAALRRLRCTATSAAVDELLDLQDRLRIEGEQLSEALYDVIGTTYTVTRRTEPRIAEQLWTALGDARTVLNVGAGTGSYEPPGFDVTAVEPSAVMRAQRGSISWPTSSTCGLIVAASSSIRPVPQHGSLT